jgi:hypothetical protein
MWRIESTNPGKDQVLDLVHGDRRQPCRDRRSDQPSCTENTNCNIKANQNAGIAMPTKDAVVTVKSKMLYCLHATDTQRQCQRRGEHEDGHQLPLPEAAQIILVTGWPVA